MWWLASVEAQLSFGSRGLLDVMSPGRKFISSARATHSLQTAIPFTMPGEIKPLWCRRQSDISDQHFQNRRPRC